MSSAASISTITDDDMASIYDVIDLKDIGGRLTSMSNGSGGSSSSKPTIRTKYHISLSSINDEELKLFHRDLVTPAPSVCGSVVALPFHRNFNNSRSRPFTRPISRSESVMLFKKINNGDEDVQTSSFDLVSSELRDFMDTNSVLMEEEEEESSFRPAVITVNRISISKKKNASNKMQDVDKFRNTLYLPQQKQQQQQQKRKESSSTTENHMKNKEATLMSRSSNPRLAAAASTAANTKFQSIAVVPNKVIQRQQQQRTTTNSNNRLVTNNKFNKDKYLYKQIPKRLISSTTTNKTPLVVTQPRKQQLPPLSLKSKRLHQPQQQSSFNCDHTSSYIKRSLAQQKQQDQQQFVTTPILPPGEEQGIHAATTNTTISRSSYSEPEQQRDTPQMLRKQQTFSGGLVRSAVAYRIDRNRSDTTSSSSSEELLEEDQLYSRGNYKGSSEYIESGGPMIAAANHDYYSSYQKQQSSYEYNLQQHRYSAPNNKIEQQHEYHKSLSSSRIKTNNNKTSGSTESVTDSAKQVLAYIRERRKSSLVIESPKLEGRGTHRFISQQQGSENNLIAAASSDFRSRLQQQQQIHNNRESESVNNHIRRASSNISSSKYTRRYNDEMVQPQYQENVYNNSKLLFTSAASRLPQRTIYR